MQDVTEDTRMLNHFIELANAKIVNTNDIKEPIVDNAFSHNNEARTFYFKTKIKLGEYKTDPRAIAKKLLNLETV